jgi:hypothetical protein
MMVYCMPFFRLFPYLPVELVFSNLRPANSASRPGSSPQLVFRRVTLPLPDARARFIARALWAYDTYMCPVFGVLRASEVVF